MNSLQYKYKLGLVGLVFIIPIVVLSFILVVTATKDVSRSVREQEALAVLPKIDELQVAFSKFVDLQMILSIKQSDAKAREELEKVVEEVVGIAQTLGTVKVAGDNEGIWSGLLESFLVSFKEVSSNTVTTMANPKEIFGLYLPLNGHITSLYSSLSNLSGLINDSDLEPFYLGKIVTDQVPKLNILVCKARGYGRFAIAEGNPTSITFDSLDAIVDEIATQGPLMSQALDFALNQAPLSKAVLKPLSENGLSSVGEISGYLIEELIEAIEIEVDDPAFLGKMKAFQEPLQEFSNETREELSHFLERRITGLKISEGLIVLFILIVVIVAVYFSLALMVAVKLTISKLSETARAMADGDTTVQADIPTKDEMLVLKDAFNTMCQRVNHLLREVQTTAEEVATQARDVEHIAAKGGEAVVEQLAMTKRVAASVAELGGSVNHVCQNTTAVASAAEDALHLADQGKIKVENSVQSTHALKNEINSSVEITNQLSIKSENISLILDVIKEIAAQTNLLSLNAAIEAARAGEHGRGFAVVAEEVRILAKRTEGATKEIEESIKSLQGGVSKAVQTMLASNQKVEDAVKESHLVSDALNLISGAVKGLTLRNAENEQATSNQQAVAHDIESNVKGITHSAQRSAEGSIQTTSASKKMAELAEKLNALVGAFKV